MEGLSDKDKHPLLGSAFYCKSRQEYELEAKQGPSGTSRDACTHSPACLHACLHETLWVCAKFCVRRAQQGTGGARHGWAELGLRYKLRRAKA